MADSKLAHMKLGRRARIVIAAAILAVAAAGAAINLHIVRVGGKLIADSPEALSGERYDAVIVLGARVYSDGTPSPRLADRVEQGVRALESGLADIIILSGDGTPEACDETGAMKRYCLARGISEEKIYTDPVGFSTLQTALNARDTFGMKRVLFVTQRYHLYRTVYTAQKLGLDAHGLSSDLREYQDELRQSLREPLARIKAAAEVLFYAATK